MRSLDRRVEALEATIGDRGKNWAPILHALSNEDLTRLEQLLLDREAGRWMTAEDLCADDLRFLETIGVES